MFKKVLIVDDVDTTNEGIMPILEKLNIPIIDQAKYCDDALLKFKKARLIQEPYDLLISDLSFIEDFRERKLKSGIELIDAIKKEDPFLKTIVFSMESRIQIVQNYVKQHAINGFVCKGRNGGRNLEKAIQAVFHNTLYLSEEVADALNKKNILNLTEYDITLMQLLADGTPQNAIPSYLKAQNITPSSLRSIENRLNQLREYFNVKTTIQLILKVKEEGVI